MKTHFKIKILAGFSCIALLILGAFSFNRASSITEMYVLTAAGVIFLLYFFYTINGTLRDQRRLEEEVLRLRSNVGVRALREVENEKIYRSLAANIPGSAITILDTEERYLLAEGDMLASMGYKKEEMPGRKISDVITPENYLWYKGLIDDAFSGKTLLKERRTPSGLDALIRVVPLKNEEGIIYAIMFVLLDVTVLKKVQSELTELNNNLELRIAAATEQLQNLNREMEGFTYSVSHDLRAPLRAIAGYARILQEDQQDKMDDGGREALEKIVHGAMRMNQLIDDLLEFSRLGRAEMRRTRIDMTGLVGEIIKELTSFEGSRKITIRQHPLANATGDLNLIRQVWINLISNALKYTLKKESCDIEIRAVQENGFVCYTISDNGAGFDMAYVGKLFGVFQRLHRMKDFEGTGIGLALVYTIVKRHNGKIWAEGKVNEGAKFHFTLPAASEDEAK